MKTTIQECGVDTTTDVLMHKQEFDKQEFDKDEKKNYFLVKEAYCSKEHQIAYVYTYKDLNPDREDEYIEEKTKEEMNSFLEFFNSPSRIFNKDEEIKEYIEENDGVLAEPNDIYKLTIDDEFDEEGDIDE